MYPGYKHSTPIQVRFSDVDRLNHVNNACYHSYIELGRVRYMNDILKHTVDWDQRGFVLARTEIDFISPLFMGDEVYCFSKVSLLGTKSITMTHVITKKNNGQHIECAMAKGVLVAADYKKNESIPLPEEWRQLVSNFEGF